jgi:hypothetical protein
MTSRHMGNVSRIVVKIGTSSLMHPNGRINLQAIDQLSYTLTGLVRTNTPTRRDTQTTSISFDWAKRIDDSIPTTFCYLRSKN